jgi:hypothetical protein
VTARGGTDLRAPALLVRVDAPEAPRPELVPTPPGGATHALDTATRCVTVVRSPATVVGIEPSGRLTAFVWGETHPHREPSEIANGFLQGGPSFARDLNGSYVILLVDTEEDSVEIVTDRMGTRRVFACEHGGSVRVSSSLAALDTAPFPVDLVGVAWYVSNGVMHMSRTPYEGVRALEPASVHALGLDGVQSRKHWRLPFEATASAVDRAELRAETLRLVQQAVERCVADRPSIFLSLSGGWDSVALAAILARSVGARDVACFSYASGTPEPGSDAWVAARVSERLGYRHEVIPSYDGDFIRHIRDNALMGQGVAHVCDEVDTWAALREQVQGLANPVLLTGEARHGNNPLREGGRARAGLYHPPGSMYPLHRIRWMRRYFPPGTFDRFEVGVTSDLARMQERADRSGGGLGYFYANARLPGVLLPWRQHFPGAYMTPRFPFLDYEMLDFMATLTVAVRRSYLFHEAMEAAYPDVFEIPRATAAGYYFDVGAEVRSHANALRDMIVSTTSRLDDVVPPSTLLRLIERVETDPRLRHRVARRGRRAVLRARRALRRRFSAPPRPSDDRWGADRVLRNLLVLREVLSAG